MFSNNLKDLRKEKKLGQKDLAEKFNVTQATISSWETGRTYPSFDQLILLADFFDVTTDYMLGRTNQNEDYVFDKDNLVAEILKNLYELKHSDKQFLLSFLKAYNKK